jgi:hypothetical protein
MLESKSTSKENSPQPHFEAASDLARRRTQGVRDAKNLVQDAFLRESVSSTVSMATMRSDGCSRLGRNTSFTEWQRRRQTAHSASVVRRVPSSRSQSSGANHVGFVTTCKSFETQVVRRADALPVQYSCMPEVDDEIAAESP